MRFCRFQQGTQIKYGLIENIGEHPTITRVLSSVPAGPASFDQGERTNLAVDEVRLLAPVQPSKIVCVGRNYREHVKEMNNAVPTEPLLFLKPPSAIIGPDEMIVRPVGLSERVDYEGELGVVIGKRCRNLQEGEDTRAYILGYTCVNDVTARDLQSKDGQWTRAKGFDTFCPIGPVVVDDLDPSRGVRVELRVNGELRQSGTTSDFIFALDLVLRYISRVMTLEPGDLIATGTPAGVGPLLAGDRVEVSIPGVGTLRNAVVDSRS